MELNEFLVKAKISTYASGAKKKILEDGAKELTFKEGGFKYRDRYYDFNPFIGEEIVWKKNKIVWAMNYYGGITLNIVSEKKVYEFLQNSLRQIKKNRPFRGPRNFKSRNFEYFDESVGDLGSFSGMERILFQGQEIYKLIYHGGEM